MKFKLYECIIKREGHTVRGHVVAPSQDVAALTVIEHDEALGLTHQDFSLERVDEKLDDELRRGLDELLRSAPVGFASYCDIGWVAHIAPIQQLKFYRTIDNKGGNVFALAPNPDIAAAIFTTALRIPKGQVKLLYISDGMADLPDHMHANLQQLLELGPVGIAEFDTEKEQWLVW